MRRFASLILLMVVAGPTSADPMPAKAVSAYPDRAQVCVERYEDLGRLNAEPTTVTLGNDEVGLTLLGGYTACGQVYTGDAVKLRLSWRAASGTGEPPADSLDYPPLSLKPGQVARLAICSDLRAKRPTWRLASPETCDLFERILWCDPRSTDCGKLQREAGLPVTFPPKAK